MPSTHKGKERSSIEGRRRSARALIDHYLDRLVDIFDFPLAPTSAAPSPTPQKWSTPTAEDMYTTMDGSSSPYFNTRARSVTTFNTKRKASMADRLRELWVNSTTAGSSKTLTRRSVTICNDSVASSCLGTAKERRKSSWLPPRSTAFPKAFGGHSGTWLECEEQDRVLECGYQCLADEASI